MCYSVSLIIYYFEAYKIVKFILIFISVLYSGTDDISAPHGIPLDLIDRLLIIRTLQYTVAEIEQIIKLRAQTEGLQIDENAITTLSEIGNSATLRYAIQLLTPAHQSCKVHGRTQITKEDILEVNSLFLDAKRSAKFLTEKNNKYLK